MLWLKRFPGITLFLRNMKAYNHFSYIFFKITLFFQSYTMLETFLEAILCKPFQLFRRILNDVSSSKKALSPRC